MKLFEADDQIVSDANDRLSEYLDGKEIHGTEFDEEGQKFNVFVSGPLDEDCMNKLREAAKPFEVTIEISGPFVAN
jgi:hypothetical protein